MDVSLPEASFSASSHHLAALVGWWVCVSAFVLAIPTGSLMTLAPNAQFPIDRRGAAIKVEAGSAVPGVAASFRR